jgi:uncharacterized protein YbbK (DUF523 family)
MGSVQVTHPFHPLRGQRFEIRNRKRWRGEELFTVCPEGLAPLSIPRDWTNLREPNHYEIAGIIQPPVSFEALDCLADLVEVLKQKTLKSKVV